jgi:hypothetical protein
MNEQAFLALVYRKPTATGLKNNVNSYTNVGLDIFICLFIFPLSIIILNKTHGRCTSYQEVLHFNSYLIIFCSFLLLVPLPLFSTEKKGEKARMRDRSNNWYSNLTLFFFIFQTPCALILLYLSLSLTCTFVAYYLPMSYNLVLSLTKESFVLATRKLYFAPFLRKLFDFSVSERSS